jgi:DNA-binding IclR family transcriptional regulator
VTRGLLERLDEGYRLGPSLLQLGLHAAEQQGLRAAVTPYVQDLFARTREIVWAIAFTDTTHAMVSHAFGDHRAADMRRPWPISSRPPRVNLAPPR